MVWFGSYSCIVELACISCIGVCLLSQLYYCGDACTCDLLILMICSTRYAAGGGGEIPWCFSQVKGTIEDEVADGEDTDVYYVTYLKVYVFPIHTRLEEWWQVYDEVVLHIFVIILSLSSSLSPLSFTSCLANLITLLTDRIQCIGIGIALLGLVVISVMESEAVQTVIRYS